MILYKAGYKYQLHKPYSIPIPIQSGQPVVGNTFLCGPFLELSPDGQLLIKSGYAWDGCSGPTWDDKTNMRAGLVHDALYQFIRNRILPEDVFRPMADTMFKQICLEDGMCSLRATLYYTAVRKFGGNAVQKPREIMEAP